MKLIQILALATAVATVATAQNSNANNASSGAQQPASKGPSATSTPVVSQGKKSAVATKPSASGPQAKPAAGAGAAAQTGNKNATGAPVTGAKPASAAPPTANKGSASTATTTKGGVPAGAGKQTPAASKTIANSPASGAAAKGTKVVAGTQSKTPAKKRGGKPAKPVAANRPKKVTKATTVSSKAEPPTPPPARPRPRIGALGRRDPFLSVIRRQESGGPGPNCSGSGEKKSCLYIPELVLQGTAKDISGRMMAIVVTGTRHTYTLRENDRVFNGSVEKITTDSVIFREFVKDAVGRESAHEVVKKLSPTS
jgi:hypothetical protein